MIILQSSSISGKFRSWLALLALATIAAVVGISQSLNGNATGSAKMKRLLLQIIDAGTGKPTPARFSLQIDGKSHFPDNLGKHGLRFVSVHKSRRQIYPVTYARGTGVVEIALPKSARQVTVHVAKGFEYLPSEVEKKITGGTAKVTARLQRWANLRKKGWIAADAHVHYDRLKPSENKDWLTMLAGDDLHSACFMVLKGGQVPGIWARQYAYGKAGDAFDGQRLISSGEEYRDGAQGHINLFRISKLIEPISTGGIGKPAVRFNYPPLHDVFEKSRKLGGFGGVAHGGSLGRTPTAVLDTVLGKVDFFEIANAHLYSFDLWHRLRNCGYDLPPTAGTDLPNYPYRDSWQPFLGSMRMYVRMGEKRDFASWKKAVRASKVIVTSGPLLSLDVNDAGPGETVSFPKEGGVATIRAELSSPIGLRSFELIRNGKSIPATIAKKKSDKAYRWQIRKKLHIEKSCWLAVRGEGVEIRSLQNLKSAKRPWINTGTIAHTAPIRVLVGKRPIRSKEDADLMQRRLRQQQEFYRQNGVYAEGKHRLHMMRLFDEAIAALRKR